MPILIVEDDEDIASLLKRAFELEGYDVDCARTGEEAIDTARNTAYDTIILDIILPGASGIEVCRRLRAEGLNATAPIIMLSARDAVPDRVEGLSAGADDYMTKPFAFQELLARVKAQKRRQTQTGAAREEKRGETFSLNPKLREIEWRDKRIDLTEREYELFEYFVKHEGQALSRSQIFDALWQGQGGVSINVVDVYVGYLRKKLAGMGRGGRSVIQTVRGVGFILRTD
ncbi:MAG: response regulator transcription factor [Hyphomicrobiales bacterium]|nr:response regulator transcription factor [Hyphomicrobiales bacterium]